MAFFFFAISLLRKFNQLLSFPVVENYGFSVTLLLLLNHVLCSRNLFSLNVFL